jgi:hypothetical protein
LEEYGGMQHVVKCHDCFWHINTAASHSRHTNVEVTSLAVHKKEKHCAKLPRI